MNNLQEINNNLEMMKGEFYKVLPPSITPEKFVRIALTEIKSNEKILNCSKESILASLMQSAELGLNISKQSGQCYLVPFKNTCTLQIGYRGLIELALRSGSVKSIQAFIVREDDLFEVLQGTESKINHVLNLDNESKPVRAVYAVACLGGRNHQFEVMSKREIDKIKSNSKSSNIWNQHYEEMAKKTVIRRLLKYVPSSPELEKAFIVDSSDFKKERVSVLNER